jgi:hypothetical protein
VFRLLAGNIGHNSNLHICGLCRPQSRLLLSAFNLLSVPIAIIRGARIVADHNASCLTAYNSISRRIARESDGDDSQSSSLGSFGNLVPAQVFTKPQYPAYVAFFSNFWFYAIQTYMLNCSECRMTYGSCFNLRGRFATALLHLSEHFHREVMNAVSNITAARTRCHAVYN